MAKKRPITHLGKIQLHPISLDLKKYGLNFEYDPKTYDWEEISNYQLIHNKQF